jgi:hypothetical protein
MSAHTLGASERPTSAAPTTLCRMVCWLLNGRDSFGGRLATFVF